MESTWLPHCLIITQTLNSLSKQCNLLLSIEKINDNMQNLGPPQYILLVIWPFGKISSHSWFRGWQFLCRASHTLLPCQPYYTDEKCESQNPTEPFLHRCYQPKCNKYNYYPITFHYLIANDMTLWLILFIETKNNHIVDV